MIQKRFWCELVIAALLVSAARPARADNRETVLIVVAAVAAAAAIAVVATVASVQHKRKKIVVTGCVVSSEKGMTIKDEEDRKLYALAGDTTAIKPGDRMSLEGRRVKPIGPDRTRAWQTSRVIKDFGVCQP
jgi:hypothetical protein